MEKDLFTTKDTKSTKFGLPISETFVSFVSFVVKVPIGLLAQIDHHSAAHAAF